MSTTAGRIEVTRFRPHALFCALLFALCELAATPFADFGVADEWSYAKSARLLAETGHIVYNGWATAMLGWQLYPAAAAIEVFGFSYDVCRMTTLAAAVVSTFLLQRIMVRCGVNERNAAIATLAVVLSPIYMQLSVTFMTDVNGLLALLLGLYGCLRAVQSEDDLRALLWLGFAVAGSAVVGSSRQLGWLGVLVMVPCALWLLRGRRRVLLGGALELLVGMAFVAWCMHWFKLQPYSLGEPILAKVHGLHDLGKMVRELARAALELPFLLTALLLAFLPEVRKNGRRFWLFLLVFGLVYAGVAVKLTRSHGPGQILEPLLNDWLSFAGLYYPSHAFLASPPPVVLGTFVRAVLTALGSLCTCCLGAFWLRVSGPAFVRRAWSAFSFTSVRSPDEPEPSKAHSPANAVSEGRQIFWLIVPFLFAYCVLLVPRSLHELFDRYLVGLTPFIAILVVRAYQDHISPRLPWCTVVAVVVVGLFGMGCVHDLFALDRARVQVAAEVSAAGVPDTGLDGGFEYNDAVELRHSPFLNDERVTLPAGSYVPMDPHRAASCDGKGELDEHYRHGAPVLGVAFRPNACGGSAGMAPVEYFSWLKMREVELFVVKYQR